MPRDVAEPGPHHDPERARRARVTRADKDFTSTRASRGNRKSHLDEHGHLVPANPAGTAFGRRARRRPPLPHQGRQPVLLVHRTGRPRGGRLRRLRHRGRHRPAAGRHRRRPRPRCRHRRAAPRTGRHPGRRRPHRGQAGRPLRAQRPHPGRRTLLRPRRRGHGRPAAADDRHGQRPAPPRVDDPRGRAQPVHHRPPPREE